MALPEIRGNGRLITDPRTGTTKTDKPWTSALIKFPVWRKVDEQWEEGEGTVASVMAYEDNAPLLAGYAKGDAIGVHGTAKAAVWNDKPRIDVTATAIWTPEKTSKASPKADANN